MEPTTKRDLLSNYNYDSTFLNKSSKLQEGIPSTDRFFIKDIKEKSIETKSHIKNNSDSKSNTANNDDLTVRSSSNFYKVKQDKKLVLNLNNLRSHSHHEDSSHDSQSSDNNDNLRKRNNNNESKQEIDNSNNIFIEKSNFGLNDATTKRSLNESFSVNDSNKSKTSKVINYNSNVNNNDNFDNEYNKQAKITNKTNISQKSSYSGIVSKNSKGSKFIHYNMSNKNLASVKKSNEESEENSKEAFMKPKTLFAPKNKYHKGITMKKSNRFEEETSKLSN